MPLINDIYITECHVCDSDDLAFSGSDMGSRIWVHCNTCSFDGPDCVGHEACEENAAILWNQYVHVESED